MKTPEDIQNQILLRSSGELSPEEQEKVSNTLANDTEADAFARFLTHDLPAAANAPRDFAAIAIAQLPARNGAFQRILPWAVAAVAVALGTLIWLPNGKKAPQTIVNYETVTPPASQRVTSSISTRLSLLEADLAASRTRLSKSRYNRHTTL